MTDNIGPFEFILQGDVEAACVAILMSATEVTTKCPATNISTDEVGFAGAVSGDPWITVQRQGGSLLYPYVIDKPRIDFGCHARLRSDALDLAQAAQASIIRESMRYAGKGVRIIHAVIETGLYRHYDKQDEAVIYVFSLRLTTRPGPA